MPIFMDRHDADGATALEVADAHAKDLAVQGKYSVRYLSYWLDEDRGKLFCLADAPDRDAAEAVHREAHGQLASDIIEVDFDMVKSFLGKIHEPATGEPYAETAFRTILFTDMAGSTEFASRRGDAMAMKVLREHDSVVRTALKTHSGQEIKHTGDGIMACFRSVVDAAQCSVTAQIALSKLQEEIPGVRIGLSAGEPVTENNDLFGSVVNLAARICNAADPGGIFASTAVKELTLGKGFTWAPRGELELKGFDEPIAVHELRYR